MRPSVLCVALASLLTSAAHAQTWNESGDAPQTLPGQQTSGSGPLTRINGTIVNAGNDADIYCIRITNRAAFSATTVGQTSLDTGLFLFDSNGRGVTMDDDVSATVTQSTITGQFVPAAGLYYLAVVTYNNKPTSASGAMWTDQPFVGERTPNGPGAAGVLSGWTGASCNAGAYSIVLTGAGFCVDTAVGCPPNFAPAVNLAGGALLDAALADFNRDGRLDLAIADGNFPNGAVIIRLGNGDGTFGPGVTYPIDPAGPSAANSVAVADFNGDGKLDIVAATGADNFGILLGNGDGTFAPVVDYFAGSFPNQVAIADFNRDGKPDIATGLVNQSQVGVRLGAANGTFGAQTTSGTGGGPYFLAAGDINGDGKPDLVTSNFSAGNVSVLLGNGDGTFQSPVNYGGVSSPESVVIADVNGDGRLDLVVANGAVGANTVAILLGNGNGTFQAAVSFPAGNGAFGLAVGDLNGDGRPDLAVANIGGGAVSVLLGNGDGTFQSPGTFTTASSPYAVAIGDINGDGRPDLVVANRGGGNASVLLQLPGVPVPTITTQPSNQSVHLGNFAFFTVAATSPSGGLTYQWRRNGVNLSDVGEIAGSHTATLQISPTFLPYDNSAIDCVVSNACGSTLSNPASLEVHDPCGSADFNGDGDVGTDADIEAFFRVLGGGHC